MLKKFSGSDLVCVAQVHFPLHAWGWCDTLWGALLGYMFVMVNRLTSTEL